MVVFAFLALVTIAGRILSGRQEDLGDFFLGGRRLPWWAVSASIIATEISAVTYISLPSIVFREGGDFSYLQIALFGYVISRILVGFLLVPAYYSGELLSPYDLVGKRLGEPARRVTTGLFSLGGVLAQSARVYLTAIVLHVLLAAELEWFEEVTGLPPLWVAVAVIVVVAVFWTWMGGVATVIWTDAMLFLSFVFGALATLWVLGTQLDGGVGGALDAAWSAGKLSLLDLSFDPTEPYTLWAALLGASIGGIGAFGTDQLVAQRLFCCASAGDARRAIIGSSLGVLLTMLVMVVGVGLWAYYQQFPMSGPAADLIAERPDRILPLFVREVMPIGLKGLVVAGALAAAISSLDSILSALSQTTLSVLKPNADLHRDGAALLRWSRGLVVGWGLVMGLASVLMESVAQRYAALLGLALAMAGFTGGALLAGVVLALRGERDGRGFVFSAPLSVLVVYGLVWHGPLPRMAILTVGAVLAGLAMLEPSSRIKRFAFIVMGTALAWGCSLRAVTPQGAVLAWPWYVPIGALVAYCWSFWLRPWDRGTAPERVVADAVPTRSAG